ncbi:hypothetical protein BWQ96_09608 [Gracilariopsis chorda]|uniref:Uncharacterized protein n=1 Tax=Gracilariopsis chorda TaxID=448386 RepID=A0A2V3IF11_9FLOR|nr:hypothetical protein BWQ96_09608 [Gracilariopsis chorda]|eukprot:PXF40675.1 hypothetical protein BWQ96_09608 [Gracilariopsis chorda]
MAPAAKADLNVAIDANAETPPSSGARRRQALVVAAPTNQPQKRDDLLPRAMLL